MRAPKRQARRIEELRLMQPLRMDNDGDGVRVISEVLGLDVVAEHPHAGFSLATAHVETLTPEWASSLSATDSEKALDAFRELRTWTPGVVRVALAVAAWRVSNGWPVRADHFVTMRDKAEPQDKSAVAQVMAEGFAQGLVI